MRQRLREIAWGRDKLRRHIQDRLDALPLYRGIFIVRAQQQDVEHFSCKLNNIAGRVLQLSLELLHKIELGLVRIPNEQPIELVGRACRPDGPPGRKERVQITETMLLNRLSSEVELLEALLSGGQGCTRM